MERRGDPIKGSKLFREFCDTCGEPMRVTLTRVGIKDLCKCEKCRGPHTFLPATKDDDNPWQQNAIRQMEDR